MNRAIILAAGHDDQAVETNNRGEVLCLAEFEGMSLLARHLDLLFRSGVASADLVVGYQARQVIDHVATLDSRPEVAFHYNPRYEQSSVLNLWAARETLLSGDAVLLIDAQLLCHPGILKRFVESNVENGFVLDREMKVEDGAMRVALHDGRMVEFSRDLPTGLEYDEVAAPLGLYRFGPNIAVSVEAECDRCESEGLADAPYEAVLRKLLHSCPLAFGFEDVSGLPWKRIEGLNDVRGFQAEAPAGVTD